jgi:hypothetical protein
LKEIRNGEKEILVISQEIFFLVNFFSWEINPKKWGMFQKENSQNIIFQKSSYKNRPIT